MMLKKIATKLESIRVPVYIGYPPTGQKVPYIVIRPYLYTQVETAITGNALCWDDSVAVYCCGESVLATDNIVMDVREQLTTCDDPMLISSINYVGEESPGIFTIQILVQSYKGALTT